jgi:hypothetical protein
VRRLWLWVHVVQQVRLVRMPLWMPLPEVLLRPAVVAAADPVGAMGVVQAVDVVQGC